MMRIYDVPVEMIEDFWPLASPLLKLAVDHNPHMEIDDLLQLLNAQYGQLSVVIESGVVTAAAVIERVVYPSHVVGNVLFMAGKKGTMGARMDALINHVTQWAKSHGCDRIAFIGLPGLAKVVKRQGGRSKHLIHAWRDL